MRSIYCLLVFLVTISIGNSQAVLPVLGQQPAHQGGECLPDAQRQTIIDRVKNNSHDKAVISKVKPLKRLVPPFLSWPLVHEPATGNEADGGYYGISNYVDNNLIYPDRLRDYTCGTRTYDTHWGYNHGGIDIFPWPFTWHKMLDEEMVVVAAAEGVVTDIVDGNFDRNCGALSATPPVANSVTITHPNGFRSLYLHLKKNSIPVKVGDFVRAGDRLGIVGSSGNSTGPHLHFEIWDEDFKIIEPFYDEDHPECHVHIENSLWLEQEPYLSPGISKIMTASSVQNTSECVEEIDDEDFFAQDQFYYGDSVFCYLYLRDQDETSKVDVKIFDATGSLYYQYSINCNSTPGSCIYFNSSYWYFSFVFSPGDACGEYTFTVNFGDEVASHNFYIEEIPTITNIEGNSNTIPGATETYSLTNPEAGSTFFWYAVGGELVSDQGTSSADILWDNVDSGKICVVMNNATGCSSGSYCEDVLLMSSATNEESLSEVKIYPNPFTEELLISTESGVVIHDYKIYDTYGRLVKDSNHKMHYKIKTTKMNSGTYILKLNTDKGIIAKKIVKH